MAITVNSNPFNLGNFGVGAGFPGLSSFNGNAAFGAASPQALLLQQVGNLPTGLGALSNGASFSSLQSPGFGGTTGNDVSPEQMVQMLSQAMAIMTQFLGAGAAQNGSVATPGQAIADSGAAPVSAPSSGAATSSATGGTNAMSGDAPSNNTTDQNEIKGYISQAAQAYGADPQVLTEMARRESSFKTDVANNWDSNAKKGTPSKGLFQFIEPTFKSMAPKAKAANPKAWEGLGELNWNDWRQQALTAAWAVANGQGSHWSTYKASGGK